MSFGDIKEYLSKGREFLPLNEQYLSKIKQILRDFNESSAESFDTSTNKSSPSYSPLESLSSIENFSSNFSPVIYLMNPEFNNTDNSEIVSCSDPDSPGYNKKSKGLNKIFSQDLKNSNNEIINNEESNKRNWDYIEVFGEVIDVVTSMLDTVEKAQNWTMRDEKNKDSVHILEIDSITTARQSLNESILTDRIVSDIKIQPNISFITSFEKKNEVEKKIEEIYLIILRLCIRNLNFDKNFGDINIEKCRALLSEQFINQTTNQSSFRWILLLNFCVIGIDLLFNCSLQTMLEFSRSFVTKFAQFESELLEILDLFETLVKEKTELSNKISLICDHLNKRSRNFPKENLKFLVFVPRKIVSLLEEIRLAIEARLGLKVKTSLETDSHFLDQNFDCLITDNQNCVSRNSIFTDLIAFEPLCVDNTKAFDLLKQTKLNCICFNSYKLKKAISEIKTEHCPFLSHQLIVSNNLSDTSDMVELFEYKLGFFLFERNSLPVIFPHPENLRNCDILLDESTGLQIYNSSEINESQIYHEIVQQSFKLKILYVVFVENQQETELVFKISRISKQVYKLNRNTDFKVKLLHLTTKESIEKLIEVIYSETLERRQRVKLTFPKLSIKPSNEEIFLNSLGCFNPFSSQYVLESKSLIELLEMNPEMSFKKFPLISKRIWELFYNILNQPYY